jgi:hypothetical protein
MQNLEDVLPYCKTSKQEEKIRAYFRYGGNISRAARELGYSRTTIQDTVKAVFKYANMHTTPNVEVDDVIEADDYLLTGTSEYYTYDDEGNMQLRGKWVKNRLDNEKILENVKSMIDSMSENVPTFNGPEKVTETSDDIITVIPFGDPHIGLKTYVQEVGEDFDLNTAKNELCNAVEYLVKTVPPSSRCVIINLGDFFHNESIFNQTTHSGHSLDVDGMVPDMINIGITAMRTAIETALQYHDTVEVINNTGNHDEVLSHALSYTLHNVYENEPRIIINTDPTYRKYVRFGKVLIGSTHGNKTKDNELPLIMATERPVDWGETEFRYYFRGHHHHSAKKEYSGCLVEQFRTLAPNDSYAHNNGYLSRQDMCAITMHKDYGEISRTTCAINMIR